MSVLRGEWVILDVPEQLKILKNCAALIMDDEVANLSIIAIMRILVATWGLKVPILSKYGLEDYKSMIVSHDLKNRIMSFTEWNYYEDAELLIRKKEET